MLGRWSLTSLTFLRSDRDEKLATFRSSRRPTASHLRHGQKSRSRNRGVLNSVARSNLLEHRFVLVIGTR